MDSEKLEALQTSAGSIRNSRRLEDMPQHEYINIRSADFCALVDLAAKAAAPVEPVKPAAVKK